MAKEAGSLVSGWWNSNDAMLRAAAADIAASIVGLSLPCNGSCGEQGDELQAIEPHAEPLSEVGDSGSSRGQEIGKGGGEEGGRGAGEGEEGDVEVESLRGMGFEMLRELFLGLGDTHLHVRVACKRSAGVIGLILLGHHPEVATLLRSSALDERWQTDLPAFMHSWLRLVSMHLPAQVPAYVELVTTRVWARRVDLVCVVAHIAGALLRLRFSVAAVARSLIMMLGHPDSAVRCAAAEALQYFLPQEASASGGAITHNVHALAPGDDAEESAIAHRLWERGNTAVAACSFHEAIAHYTEGLDCGVRASDGRSMLLSSRSAVYGLLHMWQEALEDAIACVQLAPQSASAFAGKGAALEGLMQFGEALDCFRLALSLDPSDEAIGMCVRNLEAREQSHAPQLSGIAEDKGGGEEEARGKGAGEEGTGMLQASVVRAPDARDVMHKWILEEEEGGVGPGGGRKNTQDEQEQLQMTSGDERSRREKERERDEEGDTDRQTDGQAPNEDVADEGAASQETRKHSQKSASLLDLLYTMAVVLIFENYYLRTKVQQAKRYTQVQILKSQLYGHCI